MLYMSANILLATPCYGNMMTRNYFHSVMKLKDASPRTHFYQSFFYQEVTLKDYF